VSVQQISANTPFLQGVPNSMISKEWYRVLVSVVSVLAGQSSSIDFAAFQTEYETSRQPKDYNQEISELQVLQAMTQRALSVALGLAARVQEIEAQLAKVRPSDASIDADPVLLRRPSKIYAVPTGAALATTAAVSSGAWGFSSSTQANALVTLVNAVQQGGIKNNLFS